MFHLFIGRKKERKRHFHWQKVLLPVLLAVPFLLSLKTIFHSHEVHARSFSLPSVNVANCPRGQWTVLLCNNEQQNFLTDGLESLIIKQQQTTKLFSFLAF